MVNSEFRIGNEEEGIANSEFRIGNEEEGMVNSKFRIVNEKKERGVGEEERRESPSPLLFSIHYSKFTILNSPFATRMGFRFVKGLPESEARRILVARAEAPFTSLDDLARRARLPHGSLVRLAEAGALSAFREDRRSALWAALGLDRDLHADLDLATPEPEAHLDPLTRAEAIHWDYAWTSHSTHGHPIAPYREALAQQGLPDAARVAAMKNGTRTRYAGLVICRQRPGTAAGVVFMTLEDETGLVNLVVWERVYKQHRTLVKTQSFIGVTGKLQVQSGVTHLVAEELWIPQTRLTTEETMSRDFH